MKSYNTLVEALEDLKKRGYTTDFNLQTRCIECKQTNTSLNPEEFDIVEVHRFEGMTNPDDNIILYVIESRNGMKGTLVNAYGMYADEVSQELISKLHSHH